jgi:2,4-dienoyl-CoA reductase-like NADH-dependent reductase (Old Yellow Enzyme family)
VSDAALDSPLTLPCGATLPNRLCKAAMTEGLADARLRATARHEVLYRRWSEGGAGLLVTGNVQVDRRVLERPGNVAIDMTDPQTTSPEARARLAAWARAATTTGSALWMQISHAGRQSPRYVTAEPVGPSAVQLELLGNYARPRALTEAGILDVIERFAQAAVIARETGFSGVQVHSAHGYLLSSFLSPVTNRRDDAWGGPLENRARLLLETVRAVRRAIGDDFAVGVKLNSDDFRKGGFSNEECVQVVRWLNDERIDLLELSGGTYEQPRLLGFEGKRDSRARLARCRRSPRASSNSFPAGTSPLKSIEKLPGVNFQSADPYGAYEWSTRIVVRGFNQNQLGFTLDDVPLGDMSYANHNGLHISRAILSENIGRVVLSQGTGALGTASTSNLGGTIQFYSDDPRGVFGVGVNGSYGSDDAQRSLCPHRQRRARDGYAVLRRAGHPGNREVEGRRRSGAGLRQRQDRAAARRGTAVRLLQLLGSCRDRLSGHVARNAGSARR